MKLYYLALIAKLLDKSLYFWTEHIICMKKGHTFEAEMYEKKYLYNNKLLMQIIKQTERELYG